jgi:membrane-bound lytic murein transglycosylase MltF
MTADEIRQLVHEQVTVPGDRRLVEAMIAVESGGNPRAVSRVGAQGLMQLMPAAWVQVGGPSGDPFDPRENITRGWLYFVWCLERIPPGPSVEDRRSWALAAYNGGIGYVQKALVLAQLDDPALYWQWETGRYWLMHHQCVVRSRRPDYLAIWRYVRDVRRRGVMQ